MGSGFRIRPPFFEIGPKQYLYGDELIQLAAIANRASIKHNIPVVFDPPLVHLETIAAQHTNLFVFAQHVDPIEPGRGMGAVLPESLIAAGAVGVILNHAERPLSLSDLAQAVQRSEQVGLMTIVCADSLSQSAAVTHLGPHVVVSEPTELIGTGRVSNSDYIAESVRAVKRINSDVLVLHGAGISTGDDVYKVIMAGADATGASSAIAKASRPEQLIDEMLQAVHDAWNDRQGVSEQANTLPG